MGRWFRGLYSTRLTRLFPLVLHSQRAGYAIEYDTHTNFKFVTIQGSGHMVPTYKPDFALSMITKFLNDVPFN